MSSEAAWPVYSDAACASCHSAHIMRLRRATPVEVFQARAWQTGVGAQEEGSGSRVSEAYISCPLQTLEPGAPRLLKCLP